MSNRPQPASIDPIEAFLMVNAQEIPEVARAKIREAAAKAIAGEGVTEAAYQRRVKNQKFIVKTNQIWI